MAGINGSGKSVKINKEGVRKSSKTHITKQEARKLQRYNHDTHVTALSAGRKKLSKTLLTVGITRLKILDL